MLNRGNNTDLTIFLLKPPTCGWKFKVDPDCLLSNMLDTTCSNYISLGTGWRDTHTLWTGCGSESKWTLSTILCSTTQTQLGCQLSHQTAWRVLTEMELDEKSKIQLATRLHLFINKSTSVHYIYCFFTQMTYLLQNCKSLNSTW